MNVTAIVAEYNPFHNGHAYQIEQIRHTLQSDYVIVIMSGDYVQRGEPAITDKYMRAEMALASGADLVLELPILFSCSSAPYFASGAVSILTSLGCVSHLCFGSENGTKEDFLSVAELLLHESDSFRTSLNGHLKSGLSFPAARALAIHETITLSSDFLSMPNNILGLEYTKALLEQNSQISIVPLQRIGEGYHSEQSSVFSSATFLRKAIKNGDTSALTRSMPESACQILQNYLLRSGILEADDFSSVLGYLLLTKNSPEDIRSTFDISPALANRIYQKRSSFQTFTQFAQELKTRNDTLLHINRSLMHLILQITDFSSELLTPYYTRILGMKKSAAPLLHEIKEKSAIPVLSKLGNADRILQNFYAEQPEHHDLAQKQLAQTTFGSNLYQLMLQEKYQTVFAHEYTRQFKIL